MSFEDPARYASRAENHETPVVVRNAAERAQKMISDQAIDPETFRGFYSGSMISADVAEVRRLEAKFTNNDAKYFADALEGVVLEHGELSDWFGPHAETIVPSRFDDIKNGVDLILQFDDPEDTERHLALAVDVTFGTYDSKKMRRIKDEIDRGALTEIKYFQGRTNGHQFRGELKNIPRVVVGVERDTITELSALWMGKKNKELGAHSVQHIVLQEMQEQLESYLAYAASIKKTDLVRTYEQSLKIMDAIQSQKGKPKPGEWQNDRVYLNIQRQLDFMFKA